MGSVPYLLGPARDLTHMFTRAAGISHHPTTYIPSFRYSSLLSREIHHHKQEHANTTINTSQLSTLCGICVLQQYLWLDYSEVMGTLNQMRVNRPGGEANVCLAWEGVNEDVENGSCKHWRVFVVAIRKIIPFEPLIRTASSDAVRCRQVLLAQHVLAHLLERSLLTRIWCITCAS